MAGNVNPEKRALRARLEAVRRGLSPREVEVLGGEVHERLAAQAFFGQARVVALYAAQPFEVPTAPLFEALRRRGARCTYPRVVAGRRELELREVASLAALARAPGLPLLEPGPGAPLVPPEEVDLVLVPGVAFTLLGERLGRGGGYYDVTLARMPNALRVGLAFERSLVPALPVDWHDLRVDRVVTEGRVITCPAPPG
jgi:5-formyltetrahydrofolate cyclo-ligase